MNQAIYLSILQDPPEEESATARWERGKQWKRVKEEDRHKSNLETTSRNSETRSLKTKWKGSSQGPAIVEKIF